MDALGMFRGPRDEDAAAPVAADVERPDAAASSQG
jgi:hypothetical protein